MALDILIVDDEKDICILIADILGDEGYTCRTAHSGQEALDQIKKRLPHLILQDIWLGESSFDGLRVLETVKEAHAHIPVVMMSGHGTIETAVSALKKGAYDFMEKPFNSSRLIVIVEKALENARLLLENKDLKNSGIPKDEAIVGNSDKAQALRDIIEKIAPANSRVLLKGEQGVGKEVLARLIHKKSLRHEAPFVVLNCSGLSPDELNTQLFGHESGDIFKAGVFEQAHKGTLLLHSVDEMPLETQGLMVKALHAQKFKRIGGDENVDIDVRVISSTTYDLKALIAHKSFREDLYYRLNVVFLNVPPLRERRDDFEDLFNYFANFFSNDDINRTYEIQPDALVAFKKQPWPGNMRQFRNMVEWVLLMKKEDDETVSMIFLSDLPSDILATKAANANVEKSTGASVLLPLVSMPLKQAREAFEKDYLQAQIERFDGSVAKVSAFIGMERSALHRKLKSLSIDKEAL